MTLIPVLKQLMNDHKVGGCVCGLRRQYMFHSQIIDV